MEGERDGKEGEEKEGEEKMDVDGKEDMEKKNEGGLEAKFVANFVAEVIQAAGLAPKDHSLTGDSSRLLSDLKVALIPFLRCSALFFHFLTAVPVPEQLMKSSTTEFDSLIRFLGLDPRFEFLIGSLDLRTLALNWARNPRVHAILTRSGSSSMGDGTGNLRLIRQPHGVNQLILLPSDYSDLINSVSNFSCPNQSISGQSSSLLADSIMDGSRSPTLCLVCGSILCSQSYCCQSELDGSMVGACTLHSHFCGAGIGIFLRIRDCKILLLAGRSKGN